MYVNSSDCYKYSSLTHLYRRTSKMESISLFLLLTTPNYFTP